jgi:4-hydroxy-3-methylbut-2-enyl diphosphate reductase
MSRTGLLVCAPMRVEAWALRWGLPGPVVRRTGYGARSRTVGPAAVDGDLHAVAVAGVAGSTRDEVRPGDVVVATEVSDATPGRLPRIRCPTAPLMANALRRRGCRVHTGPVRTVGHVLSATQARQLAQTGALAVDLESAPLAAAAEGRPVAVVRVVVDTPDRPLRRIGLPARGLAALARLPAVARGIDEWASAIGGHEVLLTAPRSFQADGARAIGVAHAQAPRRDTTRQHVLCEVARRSDLVLVLGPASSSDLLVLVELARRQGTPAHLVGDVHDVRPQWLAGAARIGLAAGACAPSNLIEHLLTALQGLGECRIREHTTSTW